MTTIAVSKKHNMIVCDGRQASDDVIIYDEALKIHKRGDVYVCFAGDIGMIDTLDDVAKNYPDEFLQDWILRLPETCSFTCLVWDDDIYLCKDKARTLCKLHNDYYAIGSGGDWAISAMDFGDNPKEAIKYAMSKDPFTGGKIFTEKLKGEINGTK